MKNSPLTGVLLGVLCFSVLASLVLCWLNIKYTRDLRKLQTDAAFINNNRNVINALVNEANEYSKKNPAIVPILESVGIKTATNKPASK